MTFPADRSHAHAPAYDAALDDAAVELSGSFEDLASDERVELELEARRGLRRVAGSPPSSRTSPRSSTASCAWSAWCSSACGPRDVRGRRELPARARRARRDRGRAGARRRRPAPRQARTRPPTSAPARPRSCATSSSRPAPTPSICDGELSPGQLSQLEDVVKVKVIDRTALILDIFAQHAKSREGKAQVALAQMQYMLPRLRGWGQSLSRQAVAGGSGGGGIGTRGPGETKIETDRRRIREKMAKMRREIAEMKTGRDIKRQERRATRCPRSPSPATPTPASPRCSTGSPAPACWSRTRCSPPSTRPCAGPRPPDGRVYTLADTVGFVRHLPHQLVEAFRSTMEEVGDADLILHVVDGSHPDPGEQLAAVREVFREVGAVDVPEIVVINKADIADPLSCGGSRRPSPAR